VRDVIADGYGCLAITSSDGKRRGRACHDLREARPSEAAFPGMIRRWADQPSARSAARADVIRARDARENDRMRSGQVGLIRLERRAEAGALPGGKRERVVMPWYSMRSRRQTMRADLDQLLVRHRGVVGQGVKALDPHAGRWRRGKSVNLPQRTK